MIENERWSKTTKKNIRRATDEVFVTQLSKIGRYYTEHECQIIKNKANE